MQQIIQEIITQNHIARLSLLDGLAELFKPKEERRWHANERRHCVENYPFANRRVGVEDRRA
jgi:hypothetical protein